MCVYVSMLVYMHTYMCMYIHMCMYMSKGIRFLKLRAGAIEKIINTGACMYMYMHKNSLFETPIHCVFVCICT